MQTSLRHEKSIISRHTDKRRISPLLPGILAALVGLSPAAPAAVLFHELINEDFEDGIPPGWRFVDYTGRNSGIRTNVVTGSTGSGGSSGLGMIVGPGLQAADGYSATVTNRPAGWVQLPFSILSSNAFTLSADIQMHPEGSMDDAGIFFGDLDGAYFYHLLFSEVNHNNDLFVVDWDRLDGSHSGTPSIDTYGSGIRESTWYRATLHWEPVTSRISFDISDFAGGRNGSFDLVLDGSARNPWNTAQSLNPPLGPTLQFGFGSYNDNIIIDNVLLVQEIPEPTSALLLVAASGLLVLSRRRPGA